MTPAARLAAAIEILDAWRDGTPAEQALTRWARGARYAGSGDRAAIRDHVYDVLRRKGRCAALGGAETGRGLVLGLVRLQGVAPETLFTGAGHAPPPLIDAERHAGPPHEAAADFPAWTLPLLEERDPSAALLEALAERAPVWLRVALRNGDRSAAQTALAEDGITTEPDPDTATALRVTDGARRLRQARAYADGLIELQDLSAQRAVAGIDWPSGGRILDFCAGGGGKSLAIADRADAQIFAHDALPRRMADLPARAARAGLRIETLADAGAKAPYDAVLLDVPCSGSGTWRRDPDAKWSLSPERLAELSALQDQILDTAHTLVAPTGLLVYMTCSLFRGENEGRIDAFLARHPDWILLQSRCDTPLTASDGFYTACLSRRAP